MAQINNEQYQKLIDHVHNLFEYNTNCEFCDQGGLKEKSEAKSKQLFDVDFRFDYSRRTGQPLFSGSFLFGSQPEKEMYILRVCRYCGHIEKFDFEMFVGKSFKDMIKEVKTW